MGEGGVQALMAPSCKWSHSCTHKEWNVLGWRANIDEVLPVRKVAYALTKNGTCEDAMQALMRSSLSLKSLMPTCSSTKVLCFSERHHMQRHFSPPSGDRQHNHLRVGSLHLWLDNKCKALYGMTS
eukprot:1145361-Pelagomonas_calceolata.AAC.4